MPVIVFAQLTDEQNVTVDSLKEEIAKSKHDSNAVNALISWDDIIYLSDAKLDLILNKKVDSICSENLKHALSNKEKEFFQNSRSYAATNLANVYLNDGRYKDAMSYHRLSFELEKKLGDKRGMGVAKSNMAMVSKQTGKYDESASLYFEALKLYEESKYEPGKGVLYFNLGNLFTISKDYKSAVINYRKGLISFKQSGNQRGIAAVFGSLATIHTYQNEMDSALFYNFESLKIRKEISDVRGIAHSYRNIGSHYIDVAQYDSSIIYLNKAIKVSQEFEDFEGESSSLGYLGLAYFKMGNSIEALKHLKAAFLLADEKEFISEEKRASKYLAETYKQEGKYKLALQHFENFIAIRDSLNNESNQKEIIRQDFKYRYEKQADSVAIEQLKKDELALAEEKRKDDIAKKENEKKNLIIGSVGGGLGLVLLFTFFIVNRLRITRKQKEVIESQKKEVEKQKSVVERAHEQLEEKNSEIMDSIAYAKRIQSAILPPAKLVKKYLNESFILYKPKDVVAGDFYWMEHKDNKTIFAAADCTGHGVPGAMVSVICNNGLNRSVREYGLSNPGKILDQTRELVIKEFEKSEEDVKDGMDIALCSLEGITLKYAGANNPLWIISDREIPDCKHFALSAEGDLSTLVLNEVKANKQPIGKYTDPLPFTTHEIELHKGDSIYIFSDGYVDQFGGEKGKKFKPANLRKLLLSIQDKSMEDQKTLLDEAFESWRGDLEQIDDVCIIGVRV